MQSCPDAILRLIERFDQQSDQLRSPDYNETLIRVDFINPMMSELGWDIDNRQGFAEQYRDVVHEDRVRVAGQTKAPDYSFRVGGQRKFFLEAKKPAVNIGMSWEPAYQLRRYAWSAKLACSVLTNFEAFAMYDTRIQPRQLERASTARRELIPYTDYPERWNFLAGTFSKDAVLRGEFDRYCESKKGRGAQPVDDAFLAEIEEWRKELATNLALRNESLDQAALNYAVQRIIDRIIFLRIAEDRGTETVGQLQALLNGEAVYPRLVALFRQADDRYNSGLFQFRREKDRSEPPDELTPTLEIDDKTLKRIIKALYYPASPYEFTMLSADILGSIYERFLGRVISLTGGHRAKIEEKPEVRKAGGVYYTPTYIVDYIVKNTIGKLLEGRTPKQAASIKVLDPACGSGSFLIGAYQYLLDWYFQQYTTAPSDPAALARGKKAVLRPSRTGGWALTIAERKRILLDHIHGVDIDDQAVEVTKLNLLLKCLEGETSETLGFQLRLLNERALPDLGRNIKCGNSLIGTDIIGAEAWEEMSEDERRRINPFDYERAFPQVFQRRTTDQSRDRRGASPSAGFDSVIGNPPYIRVRTLRELASGQIIDYLQERYETATHIWDVYMLFFERAMELLRRDGRLSLIVPIQTLHQPNNESVRALLLDRGSIEEVADLSAIKVFKGAIVKNCIVTVTNRQHDDAVVTARRPQTQSDLGSALPTSSYPQRKVAARPGKSLKADLLSPNSDLCERLRDQSYSLSAFYHVTFGLRSCAPGRGQGGKDRLISKSRGVRNAKPYMEGREIARFSMSPQGRYVSYLPEQMYSPRTPALFECRKIVSQTMLSRARLVATIDDKHHFVEQSLACIVPHGAVAATKESPPFALEFVLAMINSRLQSFYFATYLIDFSLGGGLIHATPGTQGKLLLPKVRLDRTLAIGTLGSAMLSLHKRLSAERNPNRREQLQREIDATDRQIDQLVYKLYGLTDAEIRTVEDATA